MKLIVKVFLILFLLLSISIFINPDILFNWMGANLSSTWVYAIAIASRVGFGVLLILAAKESKYPELIKVLGYLVIFAAVFFIFIGPASFQEILSGVLASLDGFARIGGLIGALFFSFLFFAFSGNKNLSQGSM